jgi:hypothetical protein
MKGFIYMMDDREVIAMFGRRRARCHLQWWKDGQNHIVQASGPWGIIAAKAPDAFSALGDIRQRLEVEGWLLAVAGARRDTFPSGMARDQGGGLRVYVLKQGQPAVELVDTFADAPLELVATVAEQEVAYEDWCKSVRVEP